MAEVERRKHERVEVNVLLDLHTFGRVTMLGRGCIINLSLGGCCIEAPSDFQEGISLDLRIPLAEDSSLDVLGEVVWKQKRVGTFAYGIKFTEMSFGLRRKLHKYILVRLVESNV